MKLNLNTSSDILTDKINLWRQRKGLESWLILDSLNLPSVDILSKTEHLFLFGDFVAGFLFLKEQNLHHKEIYVLCQKAKLILESLENELPLKITVIDRYELFPITKKPKKFPVIKKERIQFIYAGRISRSKNILLLLHLTSILQTEFDLNIGCSIYGEFDSVENASTDFIHYNFSFQKEVLDLIEQLPWKERPSIQHGHSPTSWISQIAENDIFINLSKFWMEDFSVSTAEVQSLGLPMILSDIGALSDVVGESVMKIPAFLLRSHEWREDNETLYALAFGIATTLVSDQLITDSKPHVYALKKSKVAKLPKFEQVVFHAALDYVKSEEGRIFFSHLETIWRASSIDKKRKKILFIITREQDAIWISLRTICKNIEMFWVQYQDDEHELIAFNAELALTKERLALLMESYDLIVAPALTPNTIKILKFIRETLNREVRIVAYPHELASIFYASLKMRKLESFFRSTDTMIVHCESDQKLTEATFKNINTLTIPAGFVSSSAMEKRVIKDYSVKNFFFIGRMSEQKNLHTLLWSMSLIKEILREGEIKLHVYGYHDHFGSPNLGIDAGAYYDYLGDLISQFQIEDLVIFHGFKHISNWSELLVQKNGIGVFPSIHSDENFGMAPFDLMSKGVPTVLTAWGGYNDLIKAFPDCTYPIPVIQSDAGPVIDPYVLAKTLKKILSAPSTPIKKIRRNLFSKIEFLELTKKTFSKKFPNHSPLLLKKDGASAQKKCQFSKTATFAGRNWPLNGVIFDNYSDPLLLKASQFYGAKKNKKQVGNTRDLVLAPWVYKKDKKFIVNDPIKGRLQFANVTELFKNGYAFRKTSL